MKCKKIAFLALMAASVAWAFAAEARFMTYPDIHEDKVVFTYEGDLWLASASGGSAARLTSFPGDEYAAKFSPDGTVAGLQRRVRRPARHLPDAGGRRRTPAPDLSAGQRADRRLDPRRPAHRLSLQPGAIRLPATPKLFWVKTDGTAPERLPLDRGTLCSFNADGTEMLYNRRGNEEYQWKRYKGGQHTDIWRYHFASRQFTPVSDYVGKNAYPMWIDGNMYFVSDRGEGGIANLYVQDLESQGGRPGDAP